MASKIGAVLTLVLFYLGIAMLPAVTMLLVQSRSFWSAINPMLLFAMVGRIGWPYLVLLVFWSLLVGGPEALQPDESQQRMSVFDGFMQQGKTDAAIAELESLLKETPRDMGLHRRMHNLLLASQKAVPLASHTRRVMPFLLETRQADIAAGFYVDCSGLSEDCAPRRADCYAKLAEALRHRGDSRRAALLVNAFSQQFPADEPSKPGFYLAVAHILAEDLNQVSQARRLLEVVEKTFPADPLMPELQAYLGTLRGL